VVSIELMPRKPSLTERLEHLRVLEEAAYRTSFEFSSVNQAFTARAGGHNRVTDL